MLTNWMQRIRARTIALLGLAAAVCEGIEDLRPFSSYEFVEALLSG